MNEFGRVADVESIKLLLILFPPGLGWIAEIAELASEAIARHAADALQLELLQAVESGFEIVQDDGVGEALEREGHFPEGVDAIGESRAFDDVGNGENVDDDEGDADKHRGEQEGEAGRDAHELDVTEFVASLDVIEQG